MEKGKSNSTLWVENKAYKYCVFRHQLMIGRGSYDRMVLIGGDITSTHCYRGKIVRKAKKREVYSDAIEI